MAEYARPSRKGGVLRPDKKPSNLSRGPVRPPGRVVTEVKKEGPSVVKKAEGKLRSRQKSKHSPKKAAKRGRASKKK